MLGMYTEDPDAMRHLLSFLLGFGFVALGWALYEYYLLTKKGKK